MKIVLDDKIRVIDFPEYGYWDEEKFYQFCAANPELNLERDSKGNILVMSPVNIKGANLELRAGTDLEIWNRQTGLGYTFSSQAGFTLPNGAVRSPDAAWVAKARYEALPDSETERFAHICPDFVIEIRSKSDSLLPLQEKMQEYMANGCRLGFLIDPYGQKAWTYSADGSITETDSFDKSLSGEAVLPGFELQLSLFRI